MQYDLAIGQSDSARDRRAGMRRRHRTLADELHGLWRASVRTVWTAPQPWWTPAVEVVTRAVADGRDATAPVTQLGRERAVAGIGLAQAVDDLNVFYRLCSGSVASPAVVRALATGWLTAGCDVPAPR